MRCRSTEKPPSTVELTPVVTGVWVKPREPWTSFGTRSERFFLNGDSGILAVRLIRVYRPQQHNRYIHIHTQRRLPLHHVLQDVEWCDSSLKERCFILRRTHGELINSFNVTETFRHVLLHLGERLVRGVTRSLKGFRHFNLGQLVLRHTSFQERFANGQESNLILIELRCSTPSRGFDQKKSAAPPPLEPQENP
jgi:hypothetical protein